jgi:hypothetical protein
MGLALNLRQIVGQLLQLDVVGNGPQLKHNAGTMEMRNSTDTGFVITRGSDPVGNNDYVTKGAGDLAYWRSVNPNWLVTDWYIDGVAGNDVNSGTVIGSPIKTGAELLRRLGPYAMWPQSVTVHVLANGMIDPLILRGAMMVAGTHLDVVGTPTQVADAGTVATYTGIVHATPAAPQVSTTLIADWTPYRWLRLRCTAGAAGTVGAVSWIAAANPAGAGLNIARTPQWSRKKTTTTPIWQYVNPVVGDSIVIESLPIIPELVLAVDGPLLQAKSPLYTNRQWSIDSISCQLITTAGTALAGWGCCITFGCVVAVFQEIGRQWGSGANQILGCLVDMADTTGSTIGLVNAGSNFLGCLFGNRTVGVFCYSTQFANLGTSLFQNVYLRVNSYAYASLFDVQFFDCTNATAVVQLSNAAVYTAFGVSGNNNTSYGLRISNSANISISSSGVYNLSGTLGNFYLAAAPAITLTLAQFAQPADYAQKGVTPAMVAGATVVTVPWYDNTTQRVTATHAAFAGTPGILSVQQISNTQFTITSSSALDTSTVNWTISPLGRNIFISTV